MKLQDICDLFEKRAELKNDMVKRIFLSVIPAVSGKSELYYSGGFPSYQLLKSAAAGANDIIKFGTRACVGELDYYGDVSGHKGEPRIDLEFLKKHYKGLVKHNDFSRYMVIEIGRKAMEKAEQSAVSTLNAGFRFSILSNTYYKQSLRLCTDAFNDTKAWDSSFGGRNWGKISSTLYDINENVIQLIINRRHAAMKRESDKDYLTEEIELMKHQIVLMNLFDGLVHNTGGIVEKLISEEGRERKKLIESKYSVEPNSMPYEEAVKLKDEQHKMIMRSQEYEVSDYYSILKMMDAKELRNPLAVYKVILPEIKNSPQKKLFEDWEERIHKQPEYRTMKSDYSGELRVVKMKKTLIKYMRTLEVRLDEIEHYKDVMLAATTWSGYGRKDDFRLSVANFAHYVSSYLMKSALAPILVEARGNAIPGQQAPPTVSPIPGLEKQVMNILVDANALYKLSYAWNGKNVGSETYTTDGTNLVHQMKQLYGKILNGVESLE